MEPADLSVLVGPLPRGDRPLASLLYEALSAAISQGRVPNGTELPSSRQAAAQLGVARNTIIAAYELLAAEGMVYQAPRRPPVVTVSRAAISAVGHAPRLALSERGERLSRPRVFAKGALRPGSPDPDLFPADLWARALRRAGRQLGGTAVLYDHFHGLPDLCAALADQFLRHQGLAVSADQILITSSTQASLTLIAQTLTDPGDQVLMESPGYGGARAAFRGAGLEVLPLSIGPNGAWTKGAAAAKLAYLTPAAQYPAGMQMSLRARQAALDWAAACGGILLSDEYGGEFLWHGAKLPSIAAMAKSASVITFGSAAKALLPGLRLGWVVVPESLVEPLRAAHHNLGMAANIHAQAALAELLKEGALRVHLRHAAKTYAQRRAMVLDALCETLGDNRKPVDPHGGLQLMLSLDDSDQENRCAEAAWAAGFGVRKLSWESLEAAHFGLIIGFADATPRKAERFAATIAAAMAGEGPSGVAM